MFLGRLQAVYPLVLSVFITWRAAPKNLDHSTIARLYIPIGSKNCLHGNIISVHTGIKKATSDEVAFLCFNLKPIKNYCNIFKKTTTYKKGEISKSSGGGFSK
ncbi:hypothetical protein M23134_01353 [Microscilla marina ATCC 23134]|uniref:Uncharacterized protein n=1 Tax=Microscilla marina ATCC 23134 TaxID=313606 RepID=A1ZJJ6_MICM2|nr:hypothetical protein M23134_01353 [Microscilla marina ATCC 23134]